MSQAEHRGCKELVANAINITCFLINRSSKAVLNRKVTEDVLAGGAVDYIRLRLFGCPPYMYVTSEDRSKLDAKYIQCIILGYLKG